MTCDTPSRTVLLLGSDHPGFGREHVVSTGGERTVCAISAGSDPLSPSMRSKGQPDEPNEDALLVRDEGRSVLLAVADSHFGVEASHAMLQAFGEIEEVPTDLMELENCLATIPERTKARGNSSTTLLVAILDRGARRGFGLSFGDSSVFLVGEGGARLLSCRTSEFIRPWEPSDLEPGKGLPFHFRTGSDQLLVAFTDGVDECHYRSPRTSVRPRHLEKLFDQLGPDPQTFARELLALALHGVDGNPGGQDNVALVVSRTEIS